MGPTTKIKRWLRRTWERARPFAQLERRQDRYVANLIVHHRFSALLIDADAERSVAAREFYEQLDFVFDEISHEALPEVSAASCFRYRWNEFGIEQRFPLIADLPWQAV